MRFDFQSVKDVMRCPKCRSELVENGDSLVSTNAECRLRFSIRDGIPIMLIEEATEVPAAEWGAIMEHRGSTPVAG